MIRGAVKAHLSTFRSSKNSFIDLYLGQDQYQTFSVDSCSGICLDKVSKNLFFPSMIFFCGEAAKKTSIDGLK